MSCRSEATNEKIECVPYRYSDIINNAAEISGPHSDKYEDAAVY